MGHMGMGPMGMPGMGPMGMGPIGMPVRLDLRLNYFRLTCREWASCLVCDLGLVVRLVLYAITPLVRVTEADK